MDVLGIKVEHTACDAPMEVEKKSEKFDESDFYTRYQKLKKQIELLSVQEEYIKGMGLHTMGHY